MKKNLDNLDNELKKLERYSYENCNTCKFELNARKVIPCFLCILGDEWKPKEAK